MKVFMVAQSHFCVLLVKLEHRSKMLSNARLDHSKL